MCLVGQSTASLILKDKREFYRTFRGEVKDYVSSCSNSGVALESSAKFIISSLKKGFVHFL